MVKAIDLQCELPCDAEVVRSTGADIRLSSSETIIGVARYKSRLTTAVGGISGCSYLPHQESGVFHNLYDSLNSLDAEIRASDQLRVQTEKMREEWIVNITHDLKTPLPHQGI